MNDIDKIVEIKIPKQGIWGGYTVSKIDGPRGYFWFGEGDRYLMSLTIKQARRVAKFLSK